MMRRNLAFYLVILLVFGSGILLILHYGTSLQTGIISPAVHAGLSIADVGVSLHANLRNSLSVLLLQIIVIVFAARMVGAVFRRLGQPVVVGEMVAGILLGPSLLGLLLPEVSAFIFPAASLGALMLLSQIGVILFMFVVGIEIDLGSLRKKTQSAVVVSHASIVVPFFLGIAFSLLVYRELAPAHISFVAFALFMGTAMSITAFPVLARILEERGLTHSPLGSVVIACAAVDDLSAWCILAVVVAVVKADAWVSAAVTTVLALLFIGVMLLFIRPQAGRILRATVRVENQSRGLVAMVLVFVFASAMFTEVIGIQALFGAFLAGIALPADRQVRVFLRERLETFSAAFLLPLFFAFTGLRTQIGLLSSWMDWLICGGLIAVAITGKLGGSMLAARFIGMSWKDAFSVGTLMNTRGLVELIVLNVGYDLGILSPRIFTMMVVMALVTTLMTGPVLSMLGFGWRDPAGSSSQPR